ncbi:hypothetical protein KGM_214242 [Danaus plexippus plexippus]|uniref:Uncharacterized protein n=1 Tax=Danaus plexippus plexippus TaxID=278856 RepID=A0A212FPP4_DANPL|nr:hypothetical protein KGM_214242 [Danaus plexippus plexippus]
MLPNEKSNDRVRAAGGGVPRGCVPRRCRRHMSPCRLPLLPHPRAATSRAAPPLTSPSPSPTHTHTHTHTHSHTLTLPADTRTPPPPPAPSLRRIISCDPRRPYPLIHSELQVR